MGKAIKYHIGGVTLFMDGDWRVVHMFRGGGDVRGYRATKQSAARCLALIDELGRHQGWVVARSQGERVRYVSAARV